MEVVTQWVRTWWSKQSRGGPEATRRNAVPIAFPVPPDTVVHEVIADERAGFEPRQVTTKTKPEGVHLEEADGLLRVYLQVAMPGMPRRWRRPPAVRIAPGEWIRWQINYRFVDLSSGNWYYRLDTLNLSYGPVRPDTFTGTPSRYVDERASLR